MADEEIHGRPVQPGLVHGRPVLGRSLRNPCVPSYHSAATSGGDHISSHIEKKHHPTRSEGEQTVEMIFRPKQ
jgi:hypothetical protein